MLSVMERSIPWHDLAQFFTNPPPRDIFTTQGLVIPTAGRERWSMLTSGCAPPLSKDWCLSGIVTGAGDEMLRFWNAFPKKEGGEKWETRLDYGRLIR
jgi:hypothetical protein